MSVEDGRGRQSFSGHLIEVRHLVQMAQAAQVLFGPHARVEVSSAAAFRISQAASGDLLAYVDCENQQDGSATRSIAFWDDGGSGE